MTFFPAKRMWRVGLVRLRTMLVGLWLRGRPCLFFRTPLPISAVMPLLTGDSYGVSLYNIAELGYVREEFKRTAAVAKEHGVDAVTPYVSLGAGDLNSFKGRVGFVNSLEYPLLNS